MVGSSLPVRRMGSEVGPRKSLNRPQCHVEALVATIETPVELEAARLMSALWGLCFAGRFVALLLDRLPLFSFDCTGRQGLTGLSTARLFLVRASSVSPPKEGSFRVHALFAVSKGLVP